MSGTPPDAPGAMTPERQAARTISEHLPKGFTADYLRERAAEEAQQPGTGQQGLDDGNSRGIAMKHGAQSTGTPSLASSLAGTSFGAYGGGQNGAGEISSSLQLQGGDMHRSLFRMAEAPSRMQPLVHQQPSPSDPELLRPRKPSHRRAATFHDWYTQGDNTGSGVVGAGRVEDSDADGNESISTYAVDEVPAMPVRDMMAPQGFRRDFVLQQQQQRERQLEERQATMQRRRAHLRARRAHAAFGAANLPIARTFVEFLELYGHFADEDLETSDDSEDEEDEEAVIDEEEVDGARQGSERQPLLGHGHGMAHGSASATATAAGVGEAGKTKAGTAHAFFTLLKAFVGTGIMFLPKAYNNGGMVFSTITLLVVSLTSMAGFQLLLQCRRRYSGGYGDIGLAIAGPRMRSLILGSITMSQLGFVCAGIVFAAENLASFASAVAHTRNGGSGDGEGAVISTNVLIALEVVVLVPLGFVRDIARLGPAALLGDVFIAIGLVDMYSYDVYAIASRGWHMQETVQLWFNPSGYALTIGAAIFTFEGIGLILPIQSSMARPERFGWLLTVVMVIITAAYVAVGALGYAAFGTYTKTEVIDNYPRASRVVQAVQCLYAVAVLAGMPVQMFPAVRIIEASLFRKRGPGYGDVVAYRSGKRNPHVKWAKNGFRALLVVACGIVAVLGAVHLDQFVALIGSLACVPLLFVYPPYLHLRAMGGDVSVLLRVLDVALIVAGIVAMVYTTLVTLSSAL